MMIKITIDGQELTVPEGLPLRKAALKNGIYIPGTCGHPDLPPANTTPLKAKIYQGEREIIGDCIAEAVGSEGGCGLCLVQVEGTTDLVRACEIQVTEGMGVKTTAEEIKKARQKALAKILAHHPHACLTCAQREGCSLTQCSSNVPVDERCCILLNRCELGKVVDYIGLPEGTPKYVYEGLSKITGDVFFNRDYNLCIGCLRCVRICKDVRQVEALGAVMQGGRIYVGTLNPGLLEQSFCRQCSACVEVCPTGALLDKPEVKPVKRGENPPCIENCPAGIDIPEYLMRIAERDYTGALEVIYQSVPFPGILGYVCFHPCQTDCKRGEVNESIAICSLKRFVYDRVDKTELRVFAPAADTGKKVAVIGAGPAGLTAAYYLRKAGHQVDIYDGHTKPGGMLRYAIPAYRLPEEVLDDELSVVFDMGVRFFGRIRVGKEADFGKLIDDRYDAVLLAVGADLPIDLLLPGGDSPQVFSALEFLEKVKLEEMPPLAGKVVVIGGGNVAIDTAMTAVRCGGEEVRMYCLEKREEMPAHSWEIAQAEEEGTVIVNSWGPVEFKIKNEELKIIRFRRCVRVFDDEGKFRPEYDENEIIEVEADYVILAVGQAVDSGFTSVMGIERLRNNRIAVKNDSFQTNVNKYFSAGDAVKGAGSVVDAIAEGKKAAAEVDKFLGGSGTIAVKDYEKKKDNPVLGRDEEFWKKPVQRPPMLDTAERVEGFGVIECVFSADNAVTEAYRCLRCNLRAAITPPFLPPDKWRILNIDNIAEVPPSEGVILVAGKDKKPIKIAGSANIKQALLEEAERGGDDLLFSWEEDRFYSKRESELLQKHLQEYGEMPGGGGGDLDDLF